MNLLKYFYKYTLICPEAKERLAFGSMTKRCWLDDGLFGNCSLVVTNHLLSYPVGRRGNIGCCNNCLQL